MALTMCYGVSRPSCAGCPTSRATAFGDRISKETPKAVGWGLSQRTRVLEGRGTDTTPPHVHRGRGRKVPSVSGRTCSPPGASPAGASSQAPGPCFSGPQPAAFVAADTETDTKQHKPTFCCAGHTLHRTFMVTSMDDAVPYWSTHVTG